MEKFNQEAQDIPNLSKNHQCHLISETHQDIVRTHSFFKLDICTAGTIQNRKNVSSRAGSPNPQPPRIITFPSRLLTIELYKVAAI
jgi:hypothetical protein